MTKLKPLFQPLRPGDLIREAIYLTLVTKSPATRIKDNNVYYYIGVIYPHKI